MASIFTHDIEVKGNVHAKGGISTDNVSAEKFDQLRDLDTSKGTVQTQINEINSSVKAKILKTSSEIKAATDSNSIAGGVAVKNLYEELRDEKAPISHASSSETYGIGNASQFGHLKLQNNLNGAADNSGAALHAQQGYELNYKINQKANATHQHTNYASTVQASGSGNAVTNLSQTNNTITFTKGSTFIDSIENNNSSWIWGDAISSITKNGSKLIVNHDTYLHGWKDSGKIDSDNYPKGWIVCPPWNSYSESGFKTVSLPSQGIYLLKLEASIYDITSDVPDVLGIFLFIAHDGPTDYDCVIINGNTSATSGGFDFNKAFIYYHEKHFSSSTNYVSANLKRWVFCDDHSRFNCIKIRLEGNRYYEARLSYAPLEVYNEGD